jgi:hypothetical protein
LENLSKNPKLKMDLKVKFTLLQNIFSRQNFLLYFVKGKFGGKKFTLQNSESTLQRSFCH